MILTNDTELLVAPKSRAPPPKPKDLTPHPPATSLDPAWDKLQRRLVRLIPAHAGPALGLVPKPAGASGAPDAAADGNGAHAGDVKAVTKDEEDDEGEGDVAYVAPGLHARLVASLGPEARCGLLWYPMPTLGAAERERRDEQDRAEGKLTEYEERVKDRMEVRVRASDMVPEDHLWVGEELRARLAPPGGWRNERAYEQVK